MPAVESPSDQLNADESWALDHSDRTSASFLSGSVRLDLHEYRSPRGTPRREGWQLNDHGILNVALGYRDWDEFDAAYRRVIAAGYHAETAPMGSGSTYDVSYCLDHDRFSVGLLCPESGDSVSASCPRPASAADLVCNVLGEHDAHRPVVARPPPARRPRVPRSNASCSTPPSARGP